MRVVYISLIFLFSSCTNHADYLKLAENEISQRIEQRFTIDNVNYWDLLYQLFNDNLEKKGYLVESNNKVKIYKKYLFEISHNGIFGSIDSSLRLRANALKLKLAEIGFFDHKGVNNKLLYELYRPSISKYRKQLENIKNIKKDQVYNIGTLNPIEYEFSPTLVMLGFSENMNNENLKRPAYEKALILIIFGTDLFYFDKKD